MHLTIYQLGQNELKSLILFFFLFLDTRLFAQENKLVKYLKPVNFQGKSLSYTDSFKNAIFSDTVNFQSTKFVGGINFDNTTFLKNVHFNSSRFSCFASFDSVSFSKLSDFRNAKFLNIVYFKNVTFSQNARFDSVCFFNDAEFAHVRFLKRAYFFGATFLKGAEFNDTYVSDGLSIVFAKFSAKSILNLSNISFSDSGRFYCRNALFPDTILFANNEIIKTQIDFETANFNAPQRFISNSKTVRPIWIYLLGSDIAKIRLDYTHFKLLLPDTTIYDHEKKYITQDEKASIYEALLNNFKTNGQTESYKLLDIEYQEFKWHNSLWTKYLIWIPRWWWDFGYDKEYIFGWTALFMIVFTCVSYFFIYSLNTRIYKIDKIPVKYSWKKKLSFTDFGNRLWCSFMYTSTVFFKLSVDIKNLEFKERRGTFYIIVVYTFGILCIAYMANFVLQKG